MRYMRALAEVAAPELRKLWGGFVSKILGGRSSAEAVKYAEKNLFPVVFVQEKNQRKGQKDYIEYVRWIYIHDY